MHSTTPPPSSTAKLMELLKASGGLGDRFAKLMDEHLTEQAVKRQPAPAAQQEAQP